MDLMTKGLPHERHERLLRLIGVGLCEQITIPLRVEDISELRKIGIKSPSGSVEFYAKTDIVMPDELSEMDYPIWIISHIKNEEGSW